MPIFLVRWPDLSAALVKAGSEDDLIDILGEVANPEGCTWSVYRGPLFIEFSLPARFQVKDRGEQAGSRDGRARAPRAEVGRGSDRGAATRSGGRRERTQALKHYASHYPLRHYQHTWHQKIPYRSTSVQNLFFVGDCVEPQWSMTVDAAASRGMFTGKAIVRLAGR